MLNLVGVVSIIMLAQGGAPPGLVRANPAAAHLEQGRRLVQSGDLAGALEAFDAAARADPKDPRAYYFRGVVLEKRHDLSGAERAYREAVDRDGRFAPARNNLGAMLLDKGDTVAAEKEIRAAISGDPKYADAHSNLGHLRDAQGKPADAVK